MFVYKLRSGACWYGNRKEFDTTEEESPIFTSLKRIRKLIRDRIKVEQKRLTDWGPLNRKDGAPGWWVARLAHWEAVEIVEYELVQRGTVSLAE